MATDISVTINPPAQFDLNLQPPNEIDLTIKEGFPKHAETHAPGGSDSLAAYYATGLVVRPSETGNFVTASQTGFYTGVFYPYSSNPNGYVQGAVVRPSNTGGFLDTGSSQTINSLKNFLVRPTVSGTGVLLSGEAVTNSQTGQFVGTGQTGNFITSSQTGQFVSTGSTGSFVTGSVVRPSETGSFITTSQTGAFVGTGQTGFYTGVFYPLNSNPSGYITGVDLSNYVTKSSTGIFVTTGQTGNFITTSQTGGFVSTGSTGSFITSSQTGQFVSTGQTGNFVTGSVVRPSETGSFITTSQTGQFVSTGSTGSFVTGSVVRPSETGAFLTTGSTGNFITSSQTGQFVSTGATGSFVTGSVVRPSETGNFITASQTGQFVGTGATGGFAVNTQVVFITGNQDVSGIKNFYSRPTVNGTGVLLSGEGAGAVSTGSLTGVFYPLNSNPSGYITGVDLSAYVTGSVVRPSETGNFITVSQTGAFYPISNPSGFITGVDLSSYVTTGQTGQFVTGSVVRPSETGNFITTGQTGQFVWTGATGSFVTTGQTGVFLTSGSPVDTIHLYGKNDQGTTIYKGNPVYIGGANGANPLIKSAANTGEFSSSKTIGLLAQDLSVNELGYAITEGILEGFDTSAGAAGDPMWLGPTGQILYGTGNKPYGLNNLVYLGVVLRSQSVNGKVYVKIQNGFEIEELHNVYALNPSNNDSLLYNSASGAWFARQINTGDVSGISAYALAANTGSFITTGQTGQFVSTGSTGSFVVSSATGAFLTTGAADGRYYGLADGQTVSGVAATGFNDAITGMTITGDTTKFITLFQRDGSTITGSFADNAGTGGSSSQYVQEIYIDAGAMLTGVSGASPSSISVSNSGIAYDCFNFDASTSGYAHFKLKLPDFNLGNLKARFDWTTSGASGGVVWGIQGVAIGDGDSLSTEWGSPQEISDSFITGTGVHVTSSTPEITLAGSPQANDLLFFRVYRDTFDAGDTLAVNACLLGLKLQYTGIQIQPW